MEHAPANFSVEKKTLSDAELEELLDIKKFRDIVTHNLQFAQSAHTLVEKDCESILTIPDFEKRFHYDGAIITKEDLNDPTKRFHKFFIADGRTEKRQDEYYLRGVRYVTSLDSNLEVRQKLRILSQDFIDGVNSISTETQGRILSGEDFLLQLGVNDYIKNAAATLLNILIYKEKIDEFKLDDAQYQDARRKAVSTARQSIRLFYSHLIGRQSDYAHALENLVANPDSIYDIVSYIENEYVSGSVSSRSFVRPEASHPLVVASAVYNMAKKIPQTDTIVGMPVGGTELAFALQYAYSLIKDNEPDVLVLPFSLHSIKKFTHRKDVSKNEVTAYLRQHDPLLNGRQVLLADDNSSTGRTLQGVHNLISSVTKPHKIMATVAEIDIIRSLLDKKNRKRTNIATPSVYEYATNILPVSKYIKPKHDMKELSEKRKLIAFYEEKLKAAGTANERITYEMFLKNLKEPTEEKLDQLNERNAILSFRHTFLSNFYIIPIIYQGVKYPSVEHAYQDQKFTPEALDKVTARQLEEINEVLKMRGHPHSIDSMHEVFRDPNNSSGSVKVIAEMLREWGYVRRGWDDDKMVLMIDLLKQKFTDPILMQHLKETEGKYLVEGNTWDDTFWGICNGRGRNFLGHILMYLREHGINKNY